MKNVFIVNKASRTGKANLVWEQVENYLRDEGIKYEVNFTNGAFDATKYAREATQNGEETVLFVMGGDGTLNEALNGIADFEKTVYVPLPSGSANDFVKGIGLEGDALTILKRAIHSDEIHRFDIGKVITENGERLFGVSAGIGVDAYVCLQALTSRLKKILNRVGLGSATYGILTVGDIFTMPFSDAHISYSKDGQSKEFDVKGTIFCAAMNCKAEGGGIPMAPNAKPDSGYLTAFYAHDISRLKCFTLMPLLVAGKHVGIKGVDLLNFDKMHIKLDSSMCVHADGEHVGFFSEVTYECMPQTLKMRGL